MPALKGLRIQNAYTLIKESSRCKLCIGHLQILRQIT